MYRYEIRPYGGRFFAVWDCIENALVCVTVYKRGAAEVIRRLSVTG